MTNGKADPDVFLQEGVRLYVEARATLYSFEQELQKVLRSTLDRFLVGHQRAAFSPTGARTASRSYGSLGDRSPYTSAWRPGTLGGKEGNFILGLWWNAHVAPEGSLVVLYANFWTTGPAAAACIPPGRPRSEAIKHRDQYFFVPYSEVPSLSTMADDAQLLLGDFAAAF